MGIIQRFLNKIRRRPAPILIPTSFGAVTESARLQAAINMRLDPNLRVRVEEIVIRECGGDVERGMAECKRRYPEVYR